MEEKNVQEKAKVNWYDMKTVDMCEKGEWFEFEMPNGETAPFKIKLVGKDSKQYKARVRKYVDKVRKKKNQSLTAIEDEEENMNVAISCTIAWEGFIMEDGKDLDITEENVRYIYTTYPWIYERVFDYVGDRSNFLSI